MIEHRTFLKIVLFLGVFGFLVWGGWNVASITPASAQAGETPTATAVTIAPTPTKEPAASQGASQGVGTGPMASDCLMCHAYKDFTGVAKDKSFVSLHFSQEEYAPSVHGKLGLGCQACHSDILAYPHSGTTATSAVACFACHPQGGGAPKALSIELPFKSTREMALKINENCRQCHEGQFVNSEDSTHMYLLENGNSEAPVCVDCHGGHDVTPPNEPRAKISQTCNKCHAAVYSSYKFSVHGAALEENNPDVPTCVDCHGGHNVVGPRNTSFRNDSIVLCAKCHANKEMMAKYNISADVFNTYLDDFHGRTVNLFREKGGSTSSNAAVCYDCHGVHSMRRPDDPLSSVNPNNLLKTCQQCHEDATARFPGAWLGHYTPNLQNAPFLYGIGMAYKILLPISFVFLGVYIVLDAGKFWAERRQKALKELEEEADDYELTNEK